MSEPRQPILEVRGLTKRFPGVIANQDVDLVLHEGEVLCLLGENGAGKSTLMNAIFGLYQPDDGQILLRGEPVAFGSSARRHRRAGSAWCTSTSSSSRCSRWSRTSCSATSRARACRSTSTAPARRIRDLSARYGLEIDPDAVVGDLSVGEQQRVELIKALYREADILILDEPTAVLTPGEVDDFFAVVRSLVEQGKSIIFITHKLREVLAVADRIVVLRGGKVVGEADPAEATQQSLATLMVGRDVVLHHRQGAGHARRGGAPRHRALRSTTTAASRPSADLDLEVRAGEVFGIAGVEGNGQRELVEALMGMRPKRSGDVEIAGSRRHPRHAPRQSSSSASATCPRTAASTAWSARSASPTTSCSTATARRPFARRGLRDEDAIRRHAERARARVRRPHAEHRTCRSPTLSGGNQQKVIIARELTGEVKLLVVAQPTRGLDVGLDRVHPPPHRRDARRRAPPCCSCRPSSTRCSTCPTASA